MSGYDQGMRRLQVEPQLRFLLPVRHRHGDLTIAVEPTDSLVHVVESVGIPHTEFELAVDGDVIQVRARSRPQPIRAARFLLDVHLGRLARHMRLLGLDTAYRNDADDDELVVQAGAEQRVLLTQDRGLLRRRALADAAYVRGSRADVQLADVLDRFAPPLAPWSRCPACNGNLEPVGKDEVNHLLEPGTRRTYEDFSRCRACGRPYWRGAHAERLDAIVAAATVR
jgi:uncharacterized protein with PIN domain